MTNLVNGFLLGVIATASLTASLFFVKFWRDTRDSFFLAFAGAFFIEGLTRVAQLFLVRPNEGPAAIHIVRLAAFLLILAAIIRKNYGRTP